MKILQKIKLTLMGNLLVYLFTITLCYILIVKLSLINVYTPYKKLVDLQEVLLQISYAIVSTSIFYYLTIYRPRERKILILLHHVDVKVKKIEYEITKLFAKINVPNLDLSSSKVDYYLLDDALKKINPDMAIDEYENWHTYLYYFKEKILALTRSMATYHDFIPEECAVELFMIEDNLMIPEDYDGYKKLDVTQLTYATIALQELYIHSRLLRKKMELEMGKRKRKLDKYVKEYREVNY